MQYDFNSKIVLVTGAASGIGLQTASEFLNAGATVILSDRNGAAGTEAVDRLHASGLMQAQFIRCDIGEEEDIDQMYDTVINQHGRVDIVVNNAGIDGELGTLDEQSTANIDSVFDVNIRGTTLSTRAAVKRMKQAGRGVIVNVASIAAHVGFARSPVYTASKHAILGLTKAVALENARYGIRVCAVSPGAVDTEMTNRFTGHDQATKKAMVEAVPLGRMCSAGEIARGILFMATQDAALLVGQTLNLDGGWANVKA
ncbi:SDR family NAD(P)-dependent oxidoreductase [Burkholderia gladioli]|uniref:SDR family NAD(P)-dependent oxidoreductase n=1 Tax=Burkholderia gladioli TaxID=28095 RepID=UPI00163EBD95|nr:SDR family oxidoreductase [Burkholderia gladioli]